MARATTSRGEGKATCAHTPSPCRPGAPRRPANRCVSQRSTPRAGTATTSAVNGSAIGSARTSPSASASTSERSARCRYSTGRWLPGVEWFVSSRKLGPRTDRPAQERRSRRELSTSGTAPAPGARRLDLRWRRSHSRVHRIGLAARRARRSWPGVRLEQIVARQARARAAAGRQQRHVGRDRSPSRPDGPVGRLYPAVYLVGGHRLTDEARVRAAWLLAGEQAAVSGAAAAYWHGLLDRAPAEVEVTVPRRNGPGCRPGALVRRRDLLAADLVRIRDVWLTDVPLTVLETAVALRDGSVFLDRALQRRVRSSTVYRAFCAEHGPARFVSGRAPPGRRDRPRRLARRAAPGAHPARCRHHRLGPRPPLRAVVLRAP